MHFPFLNFFLNLHAEAHLQQGQQREPSVMSLRSPRNAQLSIHSELSGGTQRSALYVRL